MMCSTPRRRNLDRLARATPASRTGQHEVGDELGESPTVIASLLPDRQTAGGFRDEPLGT